MSTLRRGWAGDQIGGCTGGFAVIRRSNGHQGMLSAGHCYGINATVYQYNTVMGTVTWRVYGGGSYDSEFIDAPGGTQDRVFVTDTGTKLVGNFSANPGPGDNICSDGSVNKENCHAQIQFTNQCVTFNDGTTLCHMDLAYSTNGSWIVQHGDSGGPVYSYNSDGFSVKAFGNISGDTDPDQQGSTGLWFTPFGPDVNSSLRLMCYYTCS